MHCDAHVRKMVIESAQLLSTAHRVLDGRQEVVPGYRGKVWLLPGEHATMTVKENDLGLMEKQLVVVGKQACLATHQNHGSAIWVRQTRAQYEWLFELYSALAREFEYRWDKQHAAWLNWRDFLSTPPTNIPLMNDNGMLFDLPPKMMPDHYKHRDVIEAYRAYYNGEKHFARWTRRTVPAWYKPRPKINRNQWVSTNINTSITSTATTSTTNTMWYSSGVYYKV